MRCRTALRAKASDDVKQQKWEQCAMDLANAEELDRAAMTPELRRVASMCRDRMAAKPGAEVSPRLAPQGLASGNVGHGQLDVTWHLSHEKSRAPLCM